MKMDKLLGSWNYVQLAVREKATFSSRLVILCCSVVCVCVYVCVTCDCVYFCLLSCVYSIMACICVIYIVLFV